MVGVLLSRDSEVMTEAAIRMRSFRCISARGTKRNQSEARSAEVGSDCGENIPSILHQSLC